MASYTLAGCETLINYLNPQDHLTDDEVTKFLLKYCRYYLHSFGQNFDGKYDSHVKREANLAIACRRLYTDCILIFDSGGFQISINKIKREDIPRFMDLYYNDFLMNHHALFDRAFIMDLPPGPNCEAFSDFDDVYRFNLESYQRAAALPAHIRDKIVYIHHFRTPMLHEIYTKVLRENNLFPMFKYFGTGGLVANQASDTKTPYILSTIPLVQLINDALKYGRTELPYHILGNATFRDVLIYRLLEIHVKEKHNLDLQISFDSAGLYKGIMMGRNIMVLDDDLQVRKIDLRELNLDMRCGSESITNRMKLFKVIDQMCNKSGLRKPPKDIMEEVYYWKEEINKKTGVVKRTRTFHPIVRLYISLCYLYNYAKANTSFGPVAEQLYDVYSTGDIGEFNLQLMRITKGTNLGRITRKQRMKSIGLSKSLDMLSKLDEDYCKSLIIKFLGKDEFDLDPETQILTI